MRLDAGNDGLATVGCSHVDTARVREVVEDQQALGKVSVDRVLEYNYPGAVFFTYQRYGIEVAFGKFELLFELRSERSLNRSFGNDLVWGSALVAYLGERDSVDAGVDRCKGGRRVNDPDKGRVGRCFRGIESLLGLSIAEGEDA
jgi:hypothetical protein